MGYEVLPALPEFTVAMFAKWFRVPSESIAKARAMFDAAQTAFNTSGTPFPQLSGIIPLNLFGDRTSFGTVLDAGTITTVDTYGITEWVGPIASVGSPLHKSGRTFTGTVSRDSWGTQLSNQIQDPSFIGIDCRTNRTLFTFNFQFGKGVFADKIQGAMLQVEQDTSQITNTLFPVNDGGVFWSATVPTICEDYSFPVWDNAPEGIRAFPGPGNPGDLTGLGFDITPDHWHQLILVVKFKKVATTPGAYSSACEVYAMIDKQELTHKQLGLYAVGAHDVLTPAAYIVYTQPPFVPTPPVFIPDNRDGYSITETFVGQNAPVYSWTPPAFKTGLINVPGDAASTLKVQMAELEYYDSPITDSNGNPILDPAFFIQSFVDDNGRPVSPILRDKQLSRKPYHRLHKASNWIKGQLTGVDIATATTIGDIKKYTPDPSLNGPQG